MAQVIELHTLFTFRRFCLVQTKKGVAGAVIEAATVMHLMTPRGPNVGWSSLWVTLRTVSVPRGSDLGRACPVV